MLKMPLRRVLPPLVLGSLSLSSCIVHEHSRGLRGPRGHHGRPGPGYGYGRGPGRGH